MQPNMRMVTRRAVVGIAAVGVACGVAAGCSDSADRTPQSTPSEQPGGSGPIFQRCAGISVDEVNTSLGTTDMRVVSDNASGCEWAPNADRTPTVSFNWYRGSPIGRERATEQLTRERVQNIAIANREGFIASDSGICEIGIGFGADFIEWSVSTRQPNQGFVPQPPSALPNQGQDQLCSTAKSLSADSIGRAR